jgi:hypothetical protein
MHSVLGYFTAQAHVSTSFNSVVLCTCLSFSVCEQGSIYFNSGQYLHGCNMSLIIMWGDKRPLNAGI